MTVFQPTVTDLDTLVVKAQFKISNNDGIKKETSMVIQSQLQFFKKIFEPTVKKIQDFKVSEDTISSLPIRDFLEVYGP